MPELPPKFERAYERAHAAITRDLAELPPDKCSEKLSEISAAIEMAIARDFVSPEEQKAQLRRIGCSADLDNPVEFWRWLWANAHNAGFTDAEFWKLSPRDLYAVLELKAAEIELARGSRARSRKRARASGRQETQEERAARRQAVVAPILKTKGWTPGKLCTESAVGKATVHGYLDGSRKTIIRDNRQAIAESLGIALDKLPT